MTPPEPGARPPALAVALAFLAVYLIWGSTYLAIRWGVEGLPPFLMAGTRFLAAGAILYAVLRLRGAPRPTLAHWRAAAVVGALLLLGGNGLVSWAQQSVPSGLAAVLVAMVPVWLVLLDWARGGPRPARRVAAGVALGLAGVALLVGPAGLAGASEIDVLGGAVILVATLSWAAGSLWSRRAALPSSVLLATALQMLAGGAALLAVGLLLGEAGRWPAAPPLRSLGAWAYLVVFGSLVAFSCYVWLLRVSTPGRVGTYAFVNPVVAVALGWALAAEPVTPRTLLASAVILAAVAIITLGKPAAPPDEPSAPAGPGKPAAMASEPSREA